MKFKEVLSFEWRYQLGRPAIWIYIVVLFAFSSIATISLVESVKEGEYFLNSPIIVSLITAVSSMFTLLLTAALCGNAAVRDHQSGIAPLFYTTSLDKQTYIGGRFIALIVINLVVMVALLILLFTASLIPAFQEAFSINQLASYCTAFFYFALPNSIITSSILFSISLLTRKAMAAFLGSALLFLIALFTMDILAGELGKWELAKKLDPSGVTFIKELRALQTPLELKTAFVELSPDFWINRLWWLGGAFLLLYWAYSKFNFQVNTTSKIKSRKKSSADCLTLKREWNHEISTPKVIRSFDMTTKIQQVIFLSLNSFKSMLKGKVWLIYPIIAVITIIASEEILEGQLGVPMIPTTWAVIDFLRAMGTGLILALLIAFYAGDLVWKEREARISEITDASPTQNWVFYISKFVGLIILLFFLQTLVVITGIVIQTLLGSPSVDLQLYLKVIFGLRMVDLLLFTVIAFFVQVLVNQKYVGHLIVLIAFFYMFFPGLMNLQHNLLIFGGAPDWYYSEISRFASSIWPWLWFKLYWGAWAIVVAFISNILWVRGKENKFKSRITRVQPLFSKSSAKAGFPVILMILILGGFIYYNTNILNNYNTTNENIERQVAYERKYGPYRNIVQPVLSDVKLKVDLYPEKQEAKIIGKYRIINRSKENIDTLHISTTSDVNPEKIIFSEETSIVVIDKELGHRIYRLKKPLLPGETLNLEFLAHFRQDGFGNRGRDRSIVANGTYFGYHLMPAIGYRKSRELSNKDQRKKYGLEPQPEVPSFNDINRVMDLSGNEKIHFEAVLGTSPDQMAVTAGSLKKSWVENDRRYFHYTTDVPITHNYEILSAKYEVYEDHWRDVKIQIFHHPGHTRNLDRMTRGIKSSLEYFSENFSPYPHSQVRLVEFPGSGVSLNGNPVTMTYTEGFSFFAPEKDYRNIDFPFAVTAHEVAHQWWGNELRPAYVEGAPILTESLAWYSSWMLVENAFGEDHLKRILEIMRREYLTPRSPAGLPLIRATDHFNAYRKGPFALYTIQEYVGNKKVNMALKALLEKFKRREPPLPTTMDLYAELQEVTPDSLQYLLHDLLAENTFWDLHSGTTKARPLENGNWNVNLNLKVTKTTVDEEGKVREVQVKDYIEVAVYGKKENNTRGDLLFKGKQFITSSNELIEIEVSKEPGFVEVDPNHLLMDKKISDNISVVIKEGDKEY